jgi:hypothetical protein
LTQINPAGRLAPSNSETVFTRIAACLIVSVVLWLLLWIFRR